MKKFDKIVNGLRQMVQDLQSHRDDLISEALTRRELAEDHYAAADAAEAEAVRAHSTAANIEGIIS